MDLRRYASLLWHWLWLIALGTLVAAGASYAVSSSTPKVYEASTTLLVNQAQNPGSVAYNDILTSERLTKTYGELIRKRPVLEAALSELRLSYTPADLGKMITVRAVRDTMLLELKAESTDPEEAASIANAVAQAFIEEIRRAQLGQAASSRDALKEQLQGLERDIRSTTEQLDRVRAGQDGRSAEARQAETTRLQDALSQQQLTYSQLVKSEQDMRLAEARSYSSVVVSEPAEASPLPVRPKTAQNVLLAALVGLMLAAGTALLIEYLDDKVKTDEQLAQLLGAPALGHVMRLGKQEAREMANLVQANPRAPVVESFRALRTNLQFSLLDRPGQCIMVTSAGPGEGKTTTLVNLAQVMAQAGKQVVMVDADMRRPTMHSYFELRNDLGVTTALLDPDSAELALRPTGVANLSVMTSGPLPPNPSELLASPRMEQLVMWLKEQADVILFDSPPVLVVTDATALASVVDGVLVVVDSGATRADALARVRETLERAVGPGKILGAVLNKLAPRSGQDYYHRYYQQQYGYEKNGAKGHKPASTPGSRI